MCLSGARILHLEFDVIFKSPFFEYSNMSLIELVLNALVELILGIIYESSPKKWHQNAILHNTPRLRSEIERGNLQPLTV